MTLTRSFRTNMPDEIIPIYNICQEIYNDVLNDDNKRDLLATVDYSQAKGFVWMSLNKLGIADTQTARDKGLNSPAWYARIIQEHIRRTVLSLRDGQVIYDVLVAHDMKISKDVWDELKRRGIKTSICNLRNISRSRKRPELPREAVFVLDYSVSDKHMLKTTPTGFTIKIKDEWVEFTVAIPYSVNEQFNGRLSKPRFQYSDKYGYYGNISYDLNPLIPQGELIMGVDMGKLSHNYVMARTMTRSEDFIHFVSNSKLVAYLVEKLHQLYEEFDKRMESVGLKTASIETLDNFDSVWEKQYRRFKQLDELRYKIINLKNEIARVSASELVEYAFKNGVSLIRLEDLKWLESQGGKWAHSVFQEYVIQFAEVKGITVKRIDCAYTSKRHPVTREIGTVSGRGVTFSDGEFYDRDGLATINTTRGNPKRALKKEKLPKSSETPKQIKVGSKRHQRRHLLAPLLNMQRETQIVTFSVDVESKTILDPVYTLVERVNVNSLFHGKIKGLDHFIPEIE